VETLSKGVPREIEHAVEEMPAISPVLGKINELSHEMNASPRDLVKIIMLDPVITGKVIKLVNSSFYGLPQRVQTLGQAVVLLGMNTVKNVAISTALLSTLSIQGKQSPLPQEEFWQHCLATAIACKFLAKNLRTTAISSTSADGPETYFIAGLLHDVGKILFVRADPDKYEKALEESRSLGVSLSFGEMAHFGCTHTQAGGVLARKWKLDKSLVDVIDRHHMPPGKAVSPLRGLVIISNNLCKRAGIGESGNCVEEEMADDLPGLLGIKSRLLAQVPEMLPVELEKAVEFLNCIQE
jgi:putative nucleotidyltransferase with HDIG domain